MRIKLLNRIFFMPIRDQRGSVLIEMAIILPIFLLILIAIADFGLFFNKLNIAQSAAFSGAVYCNNKNGASTFAAGTPAYDTLASFNLVDDMSSTYSCGPTGAPYWQVDITIEGNMLTPFTSAIQLYPFTVTGIATDTN